VSRSHAATKAAVEEGVVPGLFAACLCYPSARAQEGRQPRQQVGIEIVRVRSGPVRSSPRMPAPSDGAVVAAGHVDRGRQFASTRRRASTSNMIKAGVIDPTKVVSTALPGGGVGRRVWSRRRRWAEVRPERCRLAMPGGGYRASSPPRSSCRGWSSLPPAATTEQGGA